MKAIIDTSSLLSLVRYYLPFDSNNVLFKLIQTKIETGELIILDVVFEECKFVSQRLVLNKLEFLNDKEFLKKYSIPVKTSTLLPLAPGKFLNLLKNQFVIPSQFKRLTEAEFEVQKKQIYGFC